MEDRYGTTRPMARTLLSALQGQVIPNVIVKTRESTAYPEVVMLISECPIYEFSVGAKTVEIDGENILDEHRKEGYVGDSVKQSSYQKCRLELVEFKQFRDPHTSRVERGHDVILGFEQI